LDVDRRSVGDGVNEFAEKETWSYTVSMPAQPARNYEDVADADYVSFAALDITSERKCEVEQRFIEANNQRWIVLDYLAVTSGVRREVNDRRGIQTVHEGAVGRRREHKLQGVFAADGCPADKIPQCYEDDESTAEIVRPYVWSSCGKEVGYCELRSGRRASLLRRQRPEFQIESGTSAGQFNLVSKTARPSSGHVSYSMSGRKTEHSDDYRRQQARHRTKVAIRRYAVSPDSHCSDDEIDHDPPKLVRRNSDWSQQ
jgi:hypothetical protein